MVVISGIDDGNGESIIGSTEISMVTLIIIGAGALVLIVGLLAISICCCCAAGCCCCGSKAGDTSKGIAAAPLSYNDGNYASEGAYGDDKDGYRY